ncbi:hypothetical protein [Marilutibacter aestuarii]|uniref:Uncharacterized protein n=1 Tax=Marilutibacter aestuarii TaxID=1706195 RepID=A0A507ZMK4_9GAMM|nr:hypothetical protein [Lysobacter aestuarii]TQD38946.1 hypothetical protein FKV25_15770 [Lysobacter aestuarii]
MATLLALAWALKPFESYRPLYSTAAGKSQPAGEIRPGFRLVQEVHPGSVDPSEYVEGDEACFEIRFATYMRRNEGDIAVILSQDGRQHAWKIDASTLRDNAFKAFCPGPRFQPDKGFNVEVDGVDGAPGHSATLWLVSDSRLGSVDSASFETGGMALALRVSERNGFRPDMVFGIAQGGFVIGLACTLLIALAAFLALPTTTHDARSRRDDP